ncbi:polyadenylate-binding protein, cytoplasmic and nuclear [Acrasis kona]|uniref:Polyadenylate-binding protein, cytoplasmic and nuclear n=1 Tax=Acrasis kona TaxID=1008807 RepID=A0AAW2Z337_9EUKA
MSKQSDSATTQQKSSTPTTNGDSKNREVTKERRPPRREQTEGQRPRTRRHSGNSAHRTNPTGKILYIGRVYLDKLDEDQAKDKKYNNERTKLFKEVLQKYGELEKLETFDNESFAFAHFKEHDGAQAALDNLVKKSVRLQLVEELKAKLVDQNLPEIVCPPIWKYRFEWTNKDPSTGRAYSNGVDQASPSTPVDGEAKPKKPRNPKKTENEDTNGQPQQQVVSKHVKKERPLKKQTTQENKEVAPQAVEPARTTPAPVRNLQAEAERAHLRREQEYLEHQRSSFIKEIEYETGRYKDRDTRIKRLEGDFLDVQKKVSDLQEKLNKEVALGNSAKSRMQEMADEIKHTQQQEAVVLDMLKNVEAFAAAALQLQQKQ